MRIVAFDLETSDLKALMGVILCASFKEIVPPGYYGNHHDTPTRPYTLKLDRPPSMKFNANPDKKLCMAIRDELHKYNMIVGWNSKLFDLPFLNARLAYFGEAPCKPQFHLDPMYHAGGGSMRIGSKKLLNVQKFFKLGEDTDGGKTDIDWDTWKSAALGNPQAMKEVVGHCEADVNVLAAAYWKLLPHVANIHR